MGLLGEILTILNKVTKILSSKKKLSLFLTQHLGDGDSGKVLSVLEALSKSLRFQLSLDFLSKSEKRAVSLNMHQSKKLLGFLSVLESGTV